MATEARSRAEPLTEENMTMETPCPHCGHRRGAHMVKEPSTSRQCSICKSCPWFLKPVDAQQPQHVPIRRGCRVAYHGDAGGLEAPQLTATVELVADKLTRVKACKTSDAFLKAFERLDSVALYTVGFRCICGQPDPFVGPSPNAVEEKEESAQMPEEVEEEQESTAEREEDEEMAEVKERAEVVCKGCGYGLKRFDKVCLMCDSTDLDRSGVVEDPEEEELEVVDLEPHKPVKVGCKVKVVGYRKPFSGEVAKSHTDDKEYNYLHRFIPNVKAVREAGCDPDAPFHNRNLVCICYEPPVRPGK